MVKLGEMSEEPGKGGETDAEISAAAGTLFTVAAVAAVLSFGGGPAAGAGALLTSKPLCQALPVLQWAPLQLVGQLLYNGMMVLINNLSVILCVGVAAVRAKTEKQDAALLALMAYLVFLTANHTALEALGLLAQPNGMTGLAGTGQTTILGIQVVDTGVASGIVLGFAAAWLFNRTCEKQFYGMITQLYSGLRWSFLWLSALAVALGLGFCFVCPPLQRAVSALTGWIAASGNAGVFLYGFLERLLIPTGLHHLIYMPFQFSSLGGSLTVGSVTYTGAYAVCMTEYTMGLPSRTASSGCTPASPRPLAIWALRRPSSSRPAGRIVPVPPPL